MTPLTRQFATLLRKLLRSAWLHMGDKVRNIHDVRGDRVTAYTIGRRCNSTCKDWYDARRQRDKEGPLTRSSRPRCNRFQIAIHKSRSWRSIGAIVVVESSLSFVFHRAYGVMLLISHHIRRTLMPRSQLRTLPFVPCYPAPNNWPVQIRSANVRSKGSFSRKLDPGLNFDLAAIQQR